MNGASGAFSTEDVPGTGWSWGQHVCLRAESSEGSSAGSCALGVWILLPQCKQLPSSFKEDIRQMPVYWFPWWLLLWCANAVTSVITWGLVSINLVESGGTVGTETCLAAGNNQSGSSGISYAIPQALTQPVVGGRLSPGSPHTALSYPVTGRVTGVSSWKICSPWTLTRVPVASGGSKSSPQSRTSEVGASIAKSQSL